MTAYQQEALLTCHLCGKQALLEFDLEAPIPWHQRVGIEPPDVPEPELTHFRYTCGRCLAVIRAVKAVRDSGSRSAATGRCSSLS